MNKLKITLCLLVLIVNFVDGHRKKRFAVFPEGSSFSMAVCLSIAAYTSENSFFTEGYNWGIVYDLPNDTSTNPKLYTSNFIRPVLMRRKRSDLYHKIEYLLDKSGLNGKSCVLKTICEAAQMFASQKGSNLISELIRIVFSFPDHELLSTEPKVHHEYVSAHRVGQMTDNCDVIFRDCPSSVIELILFNAK